MLQVFDEMNKVIKGWQVVEKNNTLAVHCITWSEQRGEEWIKKYGDSGMFIDKALNKNSFKVIPVYQ